MHAQLKTASRCPGLAIRLAAVVIAVMAMPVAVWALDLSADQKQKLKAVGAEARVNIESERKGLGQARMDLVGVYRVYKLDERKAQDAMNRIGGAQKALLEAQLDNQNKIRQIMNADQFADFQAMISSRVHHPAVAIEPPFEEKVLEDGLEAAIRSQANLTPDQTRRVEQIKRVGQKRRETMDNMRQSVQELTGVYSKFDLDSKAARKLIDSIHRDQMSLMWMAHRRQQAIRAVLGEDQFNQLQQSIEQQFKARPHDDHRPRRDSDHKPHPGDHDK